MKKSNIITGLLYIVTGIVFLAAALFLDTGLGSLLFGAAGGFLGAGIAMISRYFYWNKPENKPRYQEKLEQEKIELHDELKVKLRDKSGRYAYVSGLIVICISIAVFSVLGELQVVGNSRLIVLFLGGYLVFQILAGIVIFRHLLKSYL